MIWRKSCDKCGRKIGKDFSYCPYCGHNSRDKRKDSMDDRTNDRDDRADYGFLGKQDGDLFDGMKMPFGFNTIFKKLVKEMDKQFREIDKEIGKEKISKINNKNPLIKQGGISINISSAGESPLIKIKSFGNLPARAIEKQIKPEEKIIKKPEISEEKVKKFAKLPRQEAESKVRRLSGKVIYEIDLPGVNNLKDIIVNKLENSIEIKAFAEDKAFFKFLPIALPLLRYHLSKGKLILELGEK